MAPKLGRAYYLQPIPSSPDVYNVVTQSDVSRHPRFYFSDGNVVFLIEMVLFKIHRYFFERDSPVFSSMFSLPPPPDDEVEGESDERPIILIGIMSKDFEHFLEILYPKDFSNCEITGTDGWLPVLKIATQWDFSSVRNLAIAKLADLVPTPAERIAIAKQYDIQPWLGPAYTTLCVRDEPLSLQEGQKLGLEDVIEIYRIRSLIRYNVNLNRHPDSISTLVHQEFKC